MTSHADLKRLATEATPGPWKVDNFWECTVVNDDGRYIAETCRSRDDPKIELRKSDAAFIAAADPSQVLALLERIARLEKALRIISDTTDPRVCCEKGAEITRAALASAEQERDN